MGAIGIRSGGISNGDLDRCLLTPLLDRLRDRLCRIFSAMAPKNDSSVGDTFPRPRLDVDVGDRPSEPGDIVPDACESVEKVRMGGGGWVYDGIASCDGTNECTGFDRWGVLIEEMVISKGRRRVQILKERGQQT